MANTGVLGMRIYTSATPLADTDGAADAIGDFQGLTIATEIGLVESFDSMGRVFTNVPFTAIGDGRTRKAKGSYDDGTVQMVVAQDLSDAGQAALKAYADASDQNVYPFKVTILGAPANFDTYYFGARVMSYRSQFGSVNNTVKAAIQLEIDTTIFTGAT